MSATRLIPFLSRSNASRILKISSPFTADIPRRIHNTPTACAKKSKNKKVQNDDLFNDEEDDLFGSSSANTQKLKVDQSIINTHTAAPKKKAVLDPVREEQLLKLEKERVRLFGEAYEKLKPLTGTNGKIQHSTPAQADLGNLAKHTKTKEDFRRLAEILRQWRVYPGRAPKPAIQNEIIDAALTNGLATDLVDVLAHVPLYGIAIMDRSRARFLMKSLVTPVDSATVDPSSPAHSQNESLMVERLNSALQLTSLLAVTRVPEAIKGSTSSTDTSVERRVVSLSPTNDLVSGMILLTAMLRAASAASNEEPPADSPNPFSAAIQLLKDLKTAEEAGTIQTGTMFKEQLWTLAAATESLAWIRGDRWSTATNGLEKDERDILGGWLETTVSNLQGGSPSTSKRWTSKQQQLSQRFSDILPL